MKNFDKNQKNESCCSFILGDSFKEISKFDDSYFDCVITSPPYFREREKNKHFNLNQSQEDYIVKILEISKEIKRVLKDEGSFWLNVGDAYSSGSLQLIPSKIAIALIQDGWILNNDIIWSKTSSSPTSYSKRLNNSYEHLFHFVKQKDFYYNITALNGKKKKPKVVDGALVSSSGVTGRKYYKLIVESNDLTLEEKENAKEALRECLDEIERGEISDFRMLIRGNNRVVSKNRLDEISRNGYLVIKARDNKPNDVWEILPEKKSEHYAPFPEDIVYFPILVSCPPHGKVLDPFCGSGTTNYVAKKLKRCSVGIDWNEEFIKIATSRCK